MSSHCTPEQSGSRPSRRPGRGLRGIGAHAPSLAALGAMLVFALTARTASADTIRFCLDKANPTFAIDEAVAKAVAASQAITPVFVVRDSGAIAAPGAGDLKEMAEGSLRDPVKQLTKLATNCDLVMGYPVEADGTRLPAGFAASAPYVGTGFVMVTAGAPITTFDTMVASHKIGTTFLSLPSAYFTEHTMTAERVYYSNEDTLKALFDGEVDAAMVWQPWLVSALASHPHTLKTAPLALPDARWEIVALYLPDGNRTPKAREFDAGLRTLARSGKLADVVQPFNVPY
jgi:polar amino acid transport system substrate-binding protein